MHKKLVSLTLLVAASLTSIPVLAATNAITKTATAKSITVLSNGTGLTGSTSFEVSVTDFPSGTRAAPKTLTSLAYTIAAYPEALTDTVQLCYYRPYSTSPSLCKIVTPGSTSTTTDFNKFQFNGGSKVAIIHDTTGAAGSQLKPSRQESVTYTYSY